MRYNKSQRNGLILLLMIISLLQIVIIKSDFIFSTSSIVDIQEQELIKSYNTKLDSISALHLKEKESNSKKKLFKFNPNKLSYSYWAYFGLETAQLYKLDSFRAINLFTNKAEVKSVLELSDSVFNILDTLMYFPKKRIDYNYYTEETEVLYTVFDPNTYKKSDWKRIGFSEKQSEIIVDYGVKIGGFKSIADLGKVFVIDENKLKELTPYIKIDRSKLLAKNNRKEVIHLNTATKLDFMEIKGIGDVLSGMIVDYRNKLGGYKYYSQLEEVKVLSKSLIDSIKVRYPKAETVKVRQININTATLEELQNHPYISYKLASGIVNFRTNFRDFKTVKEIKNIEKISEGYFHKIELYLTVL